ncbi:MAG: DUF1800 domain-containing protein [Chthoniobacteraceae bacterium]
MKLPRRLFLVGSALAAAGCGRATRQLRTDIRRALGKPTAPDLDGPLTAPASPQIDDASHVLARLTFGARPGEYARVAKLGARAFIDEQLAPDKIADTLCTRVIRHEFESLADPESTLFPRAKDESDPLQMLFPALKDRGARVGDLYEWKDKVLLADLTSATILRAVLSERQLFEVMVQFWTDHFNIDPSKGDCKWLKVADDRDVIRAHALGNFREMVRASAVSPAMLWYLDGRVNLRRKPDDKPNENYARELMELHTLGVHGGYTQEDVMEVARCLTGWTCRAKKKFFKGRVEFQKYNHDDGPKRVLGVDIAAGGGARDLDRVLEIVTSHPSCANYIAWKLCRRFIDDVPPKAAVEATARAFTESRGDIKTTLRALFARTEFWAPETRSAKFKRPFHFVVSALRATNAETDASKQLVEYLQRLGHAPFRYPTPDGYPEEATHWKPNLLWRWNFAGALVDNKIKGTRIPRAELVGKLGIDGIIATMLGRQPSEAEQIAFREAGNIAVVLASPGFQRC